MCKIVIPCCRNKSRMAPKYGCGAELGCFVQQRCHEHLQLIREGEASRYVDTSCAVGRPENMKLWSAQPCTLCGFSER